MAPKIERITEIPSLIVGEGPHWDVESQSLYLVDIFGKTVHKYVPSTGQHTQVTFEKQAALAIPVKGKPDQFIVNQEKEIVIATWDGISETPSKIEKVVDVEPMNQNKLNDGKCDTKGRLWTGTIGSPQEGSDGSSLNVLPNGALYSLENGKLKAHVKEIAISNGMTFDESLNKFYFIDSISGGVDAFDCDDTAGTLSNRTTVFNLKIHDIEGLPDGMTTDVDGNLWVAVFGSHKVVRINPREPEMLLEVVEFPAKQVTSLTWGGADLDILYVTSASFSFGGPDPPNPENGGTYKVTGLGTRGLPANNFQI